MNTKNAKAFKSMNKIYYIVVFTIFFFNIAKSEPLLLSCQIEDESENKYFLTVDLVNKTLDRAGNLYRIISIAEDLVKAERKIEIGNKKYNTTIFLDRYHGEMIFINTSKSSKDESWKIIDQIKFRCNNYPVF